MTKLTDVLAAVPDEVKEGIKTATLKSSVGVAGYSISLETAVAIATLVFFLLQIYVIVYRNWDAMTAPFEKLKIWFRSRRTS